MGKKLLLLINAIPLFFLPGISEGAIDPFLSITLDGRTRMVLTTPDGEKIGSRGFSVWQEFTGAEQYLSDSQQSISLDNPAPGEYLLEFNGIHDENFNLTFTIYDGKTYLEQEVARWNQKSTTTAMNFSIVKSNDSYTIESNQFNSPTLRAEKVEGHVKLLWDHMENISAYRIYTKSADYPYFSFLQETKGASSVLDYKWIDEEEDMSQVQYFALSAVGANGKESIFSPIVTNDDQDGDGFSDARERAWGLDPRSPDSDQDGLDDFAEYNFYNTDPLSADSDQDGFSDADEIAAGTLPNYKDSTPADTGEQTNCRAPRAGDWHVEADCLVQQSHTVPADIVIYPDAVLSLQENVTLLFDYLQHKILVLFGGGLEIKKGANILQSPR